MPRRTLHRAPTIADVARRAGVSATTVSFVLNEVADVRIADETRDRVRAAAADLGYRPNAAARLLRTRRSDTIGFVTDAVASSPYAGAIVRGAQETAWAHGKVLIIVNTNHNDAIKASAVETMLERRVEGFISAADYHQPVVPPAVPAGVPIVLLDCYATDRSVPSVVPDEVGGGRTATEALLATGHRRIGFVNLTPGIPAAIGRLDGYRQALAARGIPYDEALIRYVREGLGHGLGQGYAAARDLLALPDPPTALFCGNDRTALEAYDAIKERGLRIPRDVAVVGFDNQEIIALRLRPPLSTVALPHYEMGAWAVEYLLRPDGPPPGEPVQHKMPCPYVERASV
ncbi:MAG: LacI family DNA-binding transcriptional regulator [Chloroflexota bacterium]|nr:LacI family DNA-binding transcriptional regulator [Chloroflexota bacterium]